jgi:hypothetical protein
MGKIDKSVLEQHWVHSHEEDNDQEMVFRPASYKFPPSRGRASFDLKPDGQLTESGPGPSDRSEQKAGRWHLDANNNLVLSSGSGRDETSRVLKLHSAQRNRLVVSK